MERIRELMVSSGAYAEHERLIEDKSRAVFEALDALELDELVRAALSDIVDRALRRKSLNGQSLAPHALRSEVPRKQ